MKKLFVAAFSLLAVLSLSACASGETDESEQVGEVEVEVKGKNFCAIKCAAPPEGCHYENSRFTGPCHKLTCGDLVCDEICPIIDCAAPPDGCHYEGAIFTPCDQQTCGTLVCDGNTL